MDEARDSSPRLVLNRRNAPSRSRLRSRRLRDAAARASCSPSRPRPVAGLDPASRPGRCRAPSPVRVAVSLCLPEPHLSRRGTSTSIDQVANASCSIIIFFLLGGLDLFICRIGSVSETLSSWIPEPYKLELPRATTTSSRTTRRST